MTAWIPTNCISRIFYIDDLRSDRFRDHAIIRQWEKNHLPLKRVRFAQIFQEHDTWDINENHMNHRRTVHTFGCFLKHLNISILDYVRDKTQKPTSAKPVLILSTVYRLFTYSAAPVLSPFSALGAATRAAIFFFASYICSFLHSVKEICTQ